MASDRSGVGGLVGLAGAQAFTLILFATKGKPCECAGRFVCPNPGEQCLWGWTFVEYWLKFGGSLSVGATILGVVIASSGTSD